MARQLQPQDIPVRVTLPTKEIFVVFGSLDVYGFRL
jgi:hypothetical protein